MESNLVLVGVVHRDPRGFSRLARLFERERPDRVTVEVSRASLEFRKRVRPLSVSPALAAILRMPFEYRAARAYARRTGCAVALLEKSKYARERLAALDEWVNDGSRSERPFTIADFDRELARARAVLDHPSRALPRPAELGRRDAFAAAKLRGWATANPGAKILHVGGWEHLVRDPAGTSLYARLRDLGPRRVLLRRRRSSCGT